MRVILISCIDGELKFDSFVDASRCKNRQAEHRSAADRGKPWIVVAGGTLVAYNVEVDLTRVASGEQKSPLQTRLCDVINDNVYRWLSEVVLAKGLEANTVCANLRVRVSLDDSRTG